jgi:magnesium transporter
MAKKLLKKRPKKKIGVAPGALVHIGEPSQEQITINLIDYDGEQLHEEQLAMDDVQTCCQVKASPTVSWINVNGVHEIGHIDTLGRCFGLHPLVLEDILNTDHRPKFEDYEDCLFLVLKMLRYDREGGIQTEQVSLVLGPNYVLSFQEKVGDVFDGVRDRLRTGKGRIRKQGPDYLAYALMDAIVDGYFTILESIGDEIEEIEQELIIDPSPQTLNRIHHFRREMILLRKSVWPLREVISGLQRDESELIGETTAVFLRDVYDHTIQVVDTVETFRDIIAGMLDLYLSSISNRMNEVMKLLTIIATIFIPLTFIAGVYGMNFEYMPELRWRWSYFVLWGLMLGLAGGMFFFFRRKKWL